MTSANRALVLNADLSPVSTYPLSTWSSEKAITKVLKGRATVLATYDEEFRSPSVAYKRPSVIALTSYAKQPEKVSFTRMNLFLRDDFRCQYCGERHLPDDLTFDHVVPRVDGGPTNWENIVSACVPCNSRKGHRRDILPIKDPRRPTSWELRKKSLIRTENLHRTWLDFLYWSGVLEHD